MKVKAITHFLDVEEDKKRKIGDTWECASDRAKKLVDIKFVEEVKETKKKPAKAK